MSFRKYGEYRPSGLEWVDVLPRGWQVHRLKHLFSLMRREPQEGAETVTAFRDGQVALRSKRRTEGFTNSLQEIGYQGVRRGDLVIHAMDAFAGAIGVSEDDGKSTPVYSICTPKSPYVLPRYYSMLLRHLALSGFVTSLAKGIRERSTEFRWADAGDVSLPFPSFEEQNAIAAFLDRETGKIDALVREQKRLIELLKEKRQAVISRAVTKGLNPNVPMKASGVDRLGDVPEHWEVGSLKRFVSFLDGKRVPLSSEERSYRVGEVPYYGASGIIDWIDDFIFDEDLVLVSEDGANLINRATPIAFIATGRYWVNNHAHILRPQDGELTYWSERVEAVDLVPFVTGSAQPKLTIDALANIQIAVPATIDERKAISNFIIATMAALDPLIDEAKTGIALLEERRSALISAAVTGKIDVRDFASIETAAVGERADANL